MEHSKKENHQSNYTKFILMLSASFIAMYVTMYLNTYTIDHVYFSLTRFYMTCLGIAAMALIMLFFMREMFTNRNRNMAIIIGSLVLFISSIFLVRTQKPIDDVLWMKAMIPHHSIAILTSGRANIKDPEVRKLADDIIKAQEKEIEQMKKMIERLEDQ